MRVVRKSNLVKNLFYISPLDNLENEVLYPKVPVNFLTKNKFEDWQTKRICFYPTIDQCLSALTQQNLKGMKLTVYTPKGIFYENLIKPSITSVPTSQITDEYWYTTPVILKKLMDIKIIGEIDPRMNYSYGPRGTKGELSRWKWEEIKNSYNRK